MRERPAEHVRMAAQRRHGVERADRRAGGDDLDAVRLAVVAGSAAPPPRRRTRRTGSASREQYSRASAAGEIQCWPATLSHRVDLDAPGIDQRPASASIRPWRSTSSQSPPAVGNSSTRRAVVPPADHARTARQAMRVPAESIALHQPLTPPRWRASAGCAREQLGELVDLVRREQRRHLLPHRVLGLRPCRRTRRRPRRDAPRCARAELLEARRRRSALPRDARVARAASRGTACPRAAISKNGSQSRLLAHRALGRRAEHRPAQVRLDQPREVVVQRGDLRVGARVGEVDRVPRAPPRAAPRRS